MSLDYSTLGLPDKPEFKRAVELLYDHYTNVFTNYSGYKEKVAKEAALSYVVNNHIKTAKCILDNVENPSNELVVATILGTSFSNKIKNTFNERVNDLVGFSEKIYIGGIDELCVNDINLKHDAVSFWLADSIVGLDDAKILFNEKIPMMKRKAYPKEIELYVWSFENKIKCFEKIKGIVPGLDTVFKKAASDTRDALIKSINEANTSEEAKPLPSELKLPF